MRTKKGHSCNRATIVLCFAANRNSSWRIFTDLEAVSLRQGQAPPGRSGASRHWAMPVLFLSHSGADTKAAQALKKLSEASPSAKEAGLKVRRPEPGRKWLTTDPNIWPRAPSLRPFWAQGLALEQRVRICWHVEGSSRCRGETQGR